ncbi:hypothetical protein [Pseudanabaena sp. PCC 6802]|uniref:hypothetical protein n=1 Tax=Pseudanabaena sp. PCC 6802 TaxID=118173 RepID=UPI0003466C6A|nr:hypothetical protein [Pseudanabaena sp. PCC 6802]
MRPEIVQLQDHLQEHYGTGLWGMDTKKLGYWLRLQVGVRTRGYRLDKGSKSKLGVMWQVRKLQAN